MTQDADRNRLGDSTSPYLRQHAHNPVHWQPWDEQALATARREGKPILLSIGYSACHWCHVMAHESFEDPETAAVMNRLFVNIKVDREERPDLDKIYQLAHQLLSQRGGGWPLTVFLTPEGQIPVFAGTYFPKSGRQGLPGFVELMQRVAAYIGGHGEELEQQNEAVRDALQRLAAAPEPAAALTEEPLREARRQLQQSFDPHLGGFGPAPKFPNPTQIERLLRDYARGAGQGQPDQQALHMACFTLRRMALGGLFDQVGGGFARYSVDERWMIPHFEKMLYDNGALLALYVDAWQATGDEFYARVARETAQWLTREMQSPEGGYYASLDADSEGHEGSYYVWTREELRSLLGADDYALVSARFGLEQAANFEGRWHLHVQQTFSELATTLGRPREALAASWERVRETLYLARERRARPGCDDKLLTGWNALAIKGMLHAGRLLDEPALIDSGRRALDFLRGAVWRDGRLLASYKDGRASLPAYLDDHAFLLDALLEMLRTDWRQQDLEWAQALAEVLLDRFADREHGGFYFTADDHEALIQRPRPLMDEATPAGNGVAAYALGRLGHLLGEPRYVDAAERAARLGVGAMDGIPHGFGSLLLALEEQLQPPTLVLMRGEPAALCPWRARLRQGYHPTRLVFALPAQGAPLASAPAAEAAAVAQVCLGSRCLPLARSEEELLARLAEPT